MSRSSNRRTRIARSVSRVAERAIRTVAPARTGAPAHTAALPRRKYRPRWDCRVIAARGPGLDHAPTAPDQIRRAGSEGPRDRGNVGHGRPGATRVTGTRAIISPRLVVAPGRGFRARSWSRRDTEADTGPAGPSGTADPGDAVRLSAPDHEGPDAG